MLYMDGKRKAIHSGQGRMYRRSLGFVRSYETKNLYISCIFRYTLLIFCVYDDSIKSFIERCLDSKRELHLPCAKAISYLDT